MSLDQRPRPRLHGGGHGDQLFGDLLHAQPIDGVDLVPMAFAPEEVFHRAFKFQEFDITELSLSSHTLMTSRGDRPGCTWIVN